MIVGPVIHFLVVGEPAKTDAHVGINKWLILRLSEFFPDICKQGKGSVPVVVDTQPDARKPGLVCSPVDGLQLKGGSCFPL